MTVTKYVLTHKTLGLFLTMRPDGPLMAKTDLFDWLCQSPAYVPHADLFDSKKDALEAFIRRGMTDQRTSLALHPVKADERQKRMSLDDLRALGFSRYIDRGPEADAAIEAGMTVLVTVLMPAADGEDGDLMTAVVTVDAVSRNGALSAATDLVEASGLDGDLAGVRVAVSAAPDLLPGETLIEGGIEALLALRRARDAGAAPSLG